MKSLFRIIRRYSLMAGLIIVIILACNGCILLGIGYYTAEQQGGDKYSEISVGLMERIGAEFQTEGRGYQLSETGRELLEESEFVWAMALDREGTAVWKWRLPEGFRERYSIQEVASFSRWYLEDYPVKVLSSGELLLVFGCDPGMVSRHSLLVSPVLLENLPAYIRMFLFLNLFIIGIFILCFGYRFYGAMRPVAEGIEQLAAGEPVRLEEKGLAGGLAAKLNETSGRLLAQKEALDRRDYARTEWIAGVSHDIRTPLSLIMGHSARLSEDKTLTREHRLLAENIRRQSLIIRQLITDLNLTSRLVYQAQPLKRSRCLPASLIRNCVSDFYNEGLDTEDAAKYEFEVIISEDMEQTYIEADEGLLLRAVRNLFGNSIRHNPAGCRVKISLLSQAGMIGFFVQDTGAGIPETVVINMENPESSVHIMGLRLAEQIAKAHGGRLEFVERTEGGYDVRMWVAERKHNRLNLEIERENHGKDFNRGRRRGAE